MAKLNRETKLRERRQIKEARKRARSERPENETGPEPVSADAVPTEADEPSPGSISAR